MLILKPYLLQKYSDWQNCLPQNNMSLTARTNLVPDTITLHYPLHKLPKYPNIVFHIPSIQEIPAFMLNFLQYADGGMSFRNGGSHRPQTASTPDRLTTPPTRPDGNRAGCQTVLTDLNSPNYAANTARTATAAAAELAWRA